MIYLDTSVALAQLLAEDRRPEPSFWAETLLSSRLLEYELACVLNARRLERSHGGPARELVARFAMVELIPEILARAREPFPVPVRTLDALHVASAEFLRGQVRDLRLASYDERLLRLARRLGFDVVDLL